MLSNFSKKKLSKKIKKIIKIIIYLIILLNFLNLILYYDVFMPYVKSHYQSGSLLKFLYAVNREALLKYAYKIFFLIKKLLLKIIYYFFK
jgi:hypothetical protein